jgi:hypothetical protein
MRRNVVFMLLTLSVPLMGSDCQVTARVGGPPPPPPPPPTSPPPTQGGGAVIIVANTAGTHADEASALAVHELVSGALAASVLEAAASDARSAIRAVHASIRSESDAIPLAAGAMPVSLGATSVAAVPEPHAGLLFAVGLIVAAGRHAWIARRH